MPYHQLMHFHLKQVIAGIYSLICALFSLSSFWLSQWPRGPTLKHLKLSLVHVIDWFFESRRLLRFTASISNIGTADFKPILNKSSWLWHSCHRHFHSMEVFAHFDLFDLKSNYRIAEGHKASFCLEDNDCSTGIKPKYKCADFGDQGISVGCKDIYIATIDCQWIDITDILPGQYIFKVSHQLIHSHFAHYSPAPFLLF